MDNDNSIIERIKKVREVAGLNQIDFAKKLGIGQSTVAQMETGRRAVLDRHLRLIAAVFTVNEDWLRTGDGDMFTPVSDDDQATISPRKQALLSTIAALPDRQINVLADVVNAMSDNIRAVAKNKKGPTDKGKAGDEK